MPCVYTVWRKCIGCRIFIAHFPEKSPIISGSFAKTDRQFNVSYTSSPSCTCICTRTHRERKREREKERGKGGVSRKRALQMPPKKLSVLQSNILIHCYNSQHSTSYCCQKAPSVAAKEPYVLPPKSPMDAAEPLYIATTHHYILLYRRKRALYIAAKEPYILPQKSPIYRRKRALYIAAKEPYIMRTCMAAQLWKLS